MRHAAFACLLAFSVCVLSWALPAAYSLIFVTPIEKTKLFYSPVLGKCIYTEQIRGLDPEAAAKSEGHHADIVYKDASGVYYDRLAFEAALPFIYYRNMELRWKVKALTDKPLKKSVVCWNCRQPLLQGTDPRRDACP